MNICSTCLNWSDGICISWETPLFGCWELWVGLVVVGIIIVIIHEKIERRKMKGGKNGVI